LGTHEVVGVATVLLDKTPEMSDVLAEAEVEASPLPRERMAEEYPVAARDAVAVSESVEPPFRGFDVRYAAATTPITIKATRAAAMLRLKLDAPWGFMRPKKGRQGVH
jgi:hypothetical protein